ncbi:uncharacterized protein LOC118505355 [Anopheles stephensi]|uniref:uncharacterized protein LOC118505355 n=1 Tax=Anopheles stephensi TaxID=30069 RepID=UPI00165899BD|nr:uncharacterized protein LOC118505355 [Anopheles stephensi]XP_035896922.1 uncharacterized protein LOC118505355 [Anopheles stephensi]
MPVPRLLQSQHQNPFARSDKFCQRSRTRIRVSHRICLHPREPDSFTIDPCLAMLHGGATRCPSPFHAVRRGGANKGCCTCALQTLCCMVFVVVIICLAIALGIYFGIFHNRDSNSSTTTTTPSSLILRALMPDGFHEEKESTWVY